MSKLQTLLDIKSYSQNLTIDVPLVSVILKNPMQKLISTASQDTLSKALFGENV